MKPEPSRRKFIKNSIQGFSSLCLSGPMLIDTSMVATGIKKRLANDVKGSEELFFRISLAQWSLHRSFNDKTLKAEEFPVIAAKQFGINAVEYVNSFYVNLVDNSSFWNALRVRASDIDVNNLIIMVDDEGDLANPEDAKRNKAVENHYKWVDAAELSGCHSIRVNAFGEGTREHVGNAMVEGLGMLAEYAQKAGINVLIENHGLYSSDAKWVVDVLNRVGMVNCGTLPDFGNFCTARKWGSTQDGTCPEVYDRYLGVREMMPYARGVSAKSYRFDNTGQETTIDYGRMLRIVKDAGFEGYIGIEYEGSALSEPDGILATKNLLISEGQKI